MQVKAQRWGNSLAVRIPKVVADQVGIREQDEMEIEVTKGIIQLRPRTPEPGLNALLAGISAEDLHDETDCGQSEGREAW